MLLILFLLAGSELPYTETALASRFAYKGDKWVGGPSPCLKRVPRPDDNIIAHRTLPCWTKVRLTNLRTGKTTISYVGERGPYGACTFPSWLPQKQCPDGFWVVKKREEDPGVWRGGFDLTPIVSRRLDHNGMELIRLEVLRYPRHARPSS